MPIATEYGPLRTEIEDACALYDLSLGELTVLSDKYDPYRMDTPKRHAIGQWFKEMVDRFVKEGRRIHLRGLHYQISNSASAPIRPDGRAYLNNDECWNWLLDDASKPARWLDYVPFWRISDERNERPSDWALEDYSSEAEGSVSVGNDIMLPPFKAPAAMPGLPPQPKQPNRIVLIAEKSSTRDELAAVARDVEGELLLPTGEISDTMLYELCQRADEDDPDRPVKVFYFTDFDPAGNQMAVSASRKLQALATLLFPHLNIQVYCVALTLEQVIAYNLPSTPLKAGETRADKWKARYGREQTELDALIALHPGELRRIASDAVEPFWDATLRERSQEAATEWARQAQAQLEESEGYAEATAILKEADDALGAATAAYEDSRRRARALLPHIDTEIEAPEAELDDCAAEAALFDSDDEFVEATNKLLDRKQLR
jgi:hypothetical protein